MNNYKQLQHLEIETSFVYDVISEGELQKIEYADVSVDDYKEIAGENGTVILYTREIPISQIPKSLCYAGLVIDGDFVVVNAFDYEEASVDNLEIPDGSIGILAIGATKEDIAFVSTKFKAGDVIKLKFKGRSISIEEAVALALDDGTNPMLLLNYVDPYTTTESSIKVKGEVLHLSTENTPEAKVCLFNGKNQLVQEQNCKLKYETNKELDIVASFSYEVKLVPGANYIDVIVVDNGGIELCRKSMILFQKVETENHQKQVILWVEQYVNAEKLNTPEKMKKLIGVAKEAGVTAFALDVKGCEGFAAYKKATLTHVPYITNSINPKKQITMEIDFLEEFVQAAHSVDCKVYASLNFFVEGNLKAKDFAIKLPETHPDWAEVLQVPEDEGRLVSVLDTKRDCMLCYVNPANDEVVEFELLRAREVIENYDVDGIILDRTRYDNQFADFSSITRKKFEAYLTGKGKELKNWPQDVYSFDQDKKMVMGSLYLDWITFRSGIIKDFAKKLRNLIEEHNKKNGKQVGMAAYVGSWYELYYQNGVNWAASDFSYNERLKFPLEELYTEDYGTASYLDSIDFLMIGCYYAAKEQIEKYLTLGNILTNGRLPLIGSISLPHLTTKEMQRTGFQACYEESEGCMIFDLCYVDWEKMTYAMK